MRKWVQGYYSTADGRRCAIGAQRPAIQLSLTGHHSCRATSLISPLCGGGLTAASEAYGGRPPQRVPVFSSALRGGAHRQEDVRAVVAERVGAPFWSADESGIVIVSAAERRRCDYRCMVSWGYSTPALRFEVCKQRRQEGRCRRRAGPDRWSAAAGGQQVIASTAGSGSSEAGAGRGRRAFR